MSESVTPDMPRPPSRVVAVLLSLLAPGAGHVHVGQARRGLTLFAAVLALQVVALAVAFLLPPRAVALWSYIAVLTLVTFAIYAFGAIDAARLAGRARSSRWFVTAGAVIGAWLVAALLGEAVAQARPALPWRTFSVSSGSMAPTLRLHEWFVVDTAYYRGHAPARGELVVYRLPRDPDALYVKRIVALGGDRIEFRDGRALVNGTPLSEPYIEAGPRTPYNTMAAVTVPAGHMFVAGDNRANSTDSRVAAHGTVPVQNLVGRGTEIFWPQDKSRAGLALVAPAG
jgi:signal peptidase I